MTRTEAAANARAHKTRETIPHPVEPSRKELLSRSRLPHICAARFALYESLWRTGLSMREIGIVMMRSTNTVWRGIKRSRNL